VAKSWRFLLELQQFELQKSVFMKIANILAEVKTIKISDLTLTPEILSNRLDDILKRTWHNFLERCPVPGMKQKAKSVSSDHPYLHMQSCGD
jgi:hypothetical protein